MPIDIAVEGDVEGIRSAARWLGTTAGTVSEASSTAGSVQGQSQGAWQGPAGQGFRRVMGSASSQIGEVGTGLSALGRALDVHASVLGRVKSRMADAREKASEYLVVTGDRIAYPAPDGDPPPQWVSDAREQAYVECEQIVAHARTMERESQEDVLDLLRRQFAGMRAFSMDRIAPRLTGALLTSPRSKYRPAADSYGDTAQDNWSLDLDDLECPLDQTIAGNYTAGDLSSDNSNGYDVARGVLAPDFRTGLGIMADSSLTNGLLGLANGPLDLCIPDPPPDPSDIDPPTPPSPPAVPTGESFGDKVRDKVDELPMTK